MEDPVCHVDSYFQKFPSFMLDLRKNPIHTFILSCTFNNMALKVHPTYLFHTTRLFDTQEKLSVGFTLLVKYFVTPYHPLENRKLSR